MYEIIPIVSKYNNKSFFTFSVIKHPFHSLSEFCKRKRFVLQNNNKKLTSLSVGFVRVSNSVISLIMHVYTGWVRFLQTKKSDLQKWDYVFFICV